MDENDELYPVMYVLDPKRLNTIYRLYPNDVSEFNDYDENDDRIHTMINIKLFIEDVIRMALIMKLIMNMINMEIVFMKSITMVMKSLINLIVMVIT